MRDIIKSEFNAHIKVANSIHNLTDAVAISAQLCIDCLRNGGKILLFGNGGSAADAQHIAAELVGRYKTDRKGLSAIALTTDTSSLTSIGNDFGYKQIFNRQVESLAKKGDIVIGISTSGKSDNVISALKLASKLNCHTIGFSGQDGGKMNKICNINLVAPSDDTPRIQEMHILIGHTICHIIDQEFTG
ncbi:D-sedoheptulose 7-phosphate isomerase [Candidatus Pseudothioglobus singularis]|nr:D-sedoheptulose 7-phosphate isomerase [Candidatus Pseudothioglobus singularis]MDB4598718.1 D-sedoheptulose 7-phosphate isomerase [Candidatus Pseudothioglobus singularis]